MKALVIDSPDNMRIREVERPTLNDGEALIRVRYVGICGTDVHVFHGEHPTATFPVVPGHEFVGELVEMKGTGSEDFKLGQTVVAQMLLTCGRCDPCAKGEDNVCEKLRLIGVHADGGFAEYVRVKMKKMYVVPDWVTIERAALIEPMAVAMHDVCMSGLKVGETALVVGGGPIGLLIGCMAKTAGASRVVVSEIVESRRKLAEKFGFVAINPLEDNFSEKLLEANDGKLFDVSYEAAGVPAAITTCIDYTKNTGTVVQIAMTREAYPVDTGKIFAKELRIQGVRVHNQYAFKRAIDLIASGRVNDEIDALISKVFPFEDVAAAFDYAEKNKDAFKILVKIAD